MKKYRIRENSLIDIFLEFASVGIGLAALFGILSLIQRVCRSSFFPFLEK